MDNYFYAIFLFFAFIFGILITLAFQAFADLRRSDRETKMKEKIRQLEAQEQWMKSISRNFGGGR